MTPLLYPATIPTDTQANFITESRNVLKNILDGRDSRILVILGPCSIHDTHAAAVYAEALVHAQQKYNRELFLVMRNYFAKPRTSIGWKGLLYDPHLDGSNDMIHGIKKSCEWLSLLASMQLPAAVELLDPFVVTYWQNWITWGCIGARTVESQTHREMASAMPFPVGFKNNPQGNIDVAINGILTARNAHPRFTLNHHGQISCEKTLGNPYAHVVLRGGLSPNYDYEHVHHLSQTLSPPSYVMVDCSHANSGRNPKAQTDIIKYWSQHLHLAQRHVGFMLESFLLEGQQKLDPTNPKNLLFGQSITDACLSLDESLEILDLLAHTQRNMT
jgi:3-deoxy-7-phosphoheptulonate synthase